MKFALICLIKQYVMLHHMASPTWCDGGATVQPLHFFFVHQKCTMWLIDDSHWQKLQEHQGDPCLIH